MASVADTALLTLIMAFGQVKNSVYLLVHIYIAIEKDVKCLNITLNSAISGE